MNAYMCIASFKKPDISDVQFVDINNLEDSIKLTEVSKDHRVVISNYTKIWIDKNTNKEIKYNCIDSKEPVQMTLTEDELKNNNYIDNSYNNKLCKYCWGFSAENIDEKLINGFKINFIEKLKTKFIPELMDDYTVAYRRKCGNII